MASFYWLNQSPSIPSQLSYSWQLNRRAGQASVINPPLFHLIFVLWKKSPTIHAIYLASLVTFLAENDLTAEMSKLRPELRRSLYLLRTEAAKLRNSKQLLRLSLLLRTIWRLRIQSWDLENWEGYELTALLRTEKAIDQNWDVWDW